MFIHTGDSWVIGGINSWISDVNHNGLLMDYGDRMAVTRVSIFADWVYGTIPEPTTALLGVVLLPFLRRRCFTSNAPPTTRHCACRKSPRSDVCRSTQTKQTCHFATSRFDFTPTDRGSWSPARTAA
jgi:hypothetical protein